eukprot:m.157479 g.157479  ORF g.157479 m.157479 type:complete len:237 (-) comp9810_c0_seq19:533-1243(-)
MCRSASASTTPRSRPAATAARAAAFLWPASLGSWAFLWVGKDIFSLCVELYFARLSLLRLPPTLSLALTRLTPGSGMGICSTLLCLLFLCIFWRYCLDRVRGRSGGSNGSGGSGGQNSVHITTAGDQQTVSKSSSTGSALWRILSSPLIILGYCCVRCVRCARPEPAPGRPPKPPPRGELMSILPPSVLGDANEGAACTHLRGALSIQLAYLCDYFVPFSGWKSIGLPSCSQQCRS